MSYVVNTNHVFLTLVLRFSFYAHMLRLGVKKDPTFKWINNVVLCNGNHKIFDCHEFKGSGLE